MDSLAEDRKTVEDIDTLISAHAHELSAKLQAHRLELFPPAAEKPLRVFQAAEVAKLLGVKSGYLRNLSLEGKGPDPIVTSSGRRFYIPPSRSSSFASILTKQDVRAAAMSRIDVVRNSFRSSLSSTSRAGAARQRRLRIWPNTSR